MTGDRKQSLKRAIAAAHAGEMVVIAGQRDVGLMIALVRSVDGLTAEHVNFMIAHARGPLYVTLPEERLEKLGLAVMRSADLTPDGRSLHVPVDVFAGTTTGVSAADRARTIRALVAPDSRMRDFRIPGHVTPIGCRKGGVLERPGHTEATVDLMRLAGRSPAAVVCPMLGDDGDAAGLEYARQFTATHGFEFVWIQDIIDYRRALEDVIERSGEVNLPLPCATFRAIGYRDRYAVGEHLALVAGRIESADVVAVRCHTECLAGDALRSRACPCRRQLERSLEEIVGLGCGVLLYLRAPGGDCDKLRHLLGPSNASHAAREYQDNGVTISILRDLGVDADRADLVVT